MEVVKASVIKRKMGHPPTWREGCKGRDVVWKGIASLVGNIPVACSSMPFSLLV